MQRNNNSHHNKMLFVFGLGKTRSRLHSLIGWGFDINFKHGVYGILSNKGNTIKLQFIQINIQNCLSNYRLDFNHQRA